jgi:regulator of sigma D
VVLAKVKKSNMDRVAIKDFVYGGIMELMRNRQYYYHSGVNSTYSHWTDEGKVALVEYMTLVSAKMHDAEQTELNARAKELVLNELKSKD